MVSDERYIKAFVKGYPKRLETLQNKRGLYEDIMADVRSMEDLSHKRRQELLDLIGKEQKKETLRFATFKVLRAAQSSKSIDFRRADSTLTTTVANYAYDLVHAARNTQRALQAFLKSLEKQAQTLESITDSKEAARLLIEDYDRTRAYVAQHAQHEMENAHRVLRSMQAYIQANEKTFRREAAKGIALGATAIMSAVVATATLGIILGLLWAGPETQSFTNAAVAFVSAAYVMVFSAITGWQALENGGLLREELALLK